MRGTAPFRKLGDAYVASDEYSTLYIKRLTSGRFALMTRLRPPQGGWSTLGVHGTLAAAVADGRALLGLDGGE